MKNKKFLVGALALLVVGVTASFVLRWYLNRPASMVVTEKDVYAARLRLGHDTRPTQPVPKPLALDRPVRLAIGSLGFTDEERNRGVADLVLAALTGTSGLDLIERQSLDKILYELNLSLSGLLRAKDAVRVGRLLKADCFLPGPRRKSPEQIRSWCGLWTRGPGFCATREFFLPTNRRHNSQRT